METENPHNYRKVGYGMILVAGSLATIALIGVIIGEDVLYGDKIQRANTANFEECKAADFALPQCDIFWSKINNDLADIYVDPQT